MIPLDYLVLRLVRRHLPDRIVRELPARRIVVRPGLEAADPPAGSRPTSFSPTPCSSTWAALRGRCRNWRGLLNPGSNLDRLRAGDYARIFRASFSRVTLEPLAADPAAFRAARPRIRPEFLTGDQTRDAVTWILVRVSSG